jgi:valyl-tRNA synthetase
MLNDRFDPAAAEGRIYKAWEEADCFKPSGDTSAEAYSIVIPPPNVTGVLHMGHALNNTLQDVLIRFERMRGKNVLWQPGMDHAGIATQMVVERQLAADGNESRASLGRDAFVERVWQWKEESGGQIKGQLKRLGASCDWSKERFTLDEGLNEAVNKVFVEMYNTLSDPNDPNSRRLIYRDKRLVNWDPHFQTAISDLEVEMREVKGSYWHLRYPLADGEAYEHPIVDEDGEPAGTETRDYLVVATSRPETMLGDTCVAVHPDDERYKSLHGKFIDLPIVGRRIPIVADEYPDPEKGSGAVKITPAHDFNDFEVGKRAGHTPLNILTAVAAIVDGDEADAAGIPADLRGLDRFEARKAVVSFFEDNDLMAEIEKLKIEQPFGDRSNVVIEPWMTDQWYVDAKTLAQPAIAAVKDGKTRFVPQNWEKTYYNWMDNIQPWCISRQLWWGHRIPVWYGIDRKIIGGQGSSSTVGWAEEYTDEEGNTSTRSALNHYVKHTEEEAIGAALSSAREMHSCFESVMLVSNRKEAEEVFQKQYEKVRAEADPKLVYPVWRDEDVLDTWFSSALWPFSTQGWPNETADLKTFYPTATLVTAFDIIFFWVARMMMQGLQFMGEVPFKDVYIHALVLDEKGQKMSKSKGNAMDPLELVDEFGADALRFTMAAMAAQGRNIRLSKQRVEGYRNFGSKLWSAARFAEMNEATAPADFKSAALTQPVNKWIVGELATCAADVTKSIEDYRFNDAASALYKFIWNQLCDWYLELVKPLLSGDDAAVKAETRDTLGYVLDETCKLLHPFMPFITEELWEARAPGRSEGGNYLMLKDWPTYGVELRDAASDAEIVWVMDMISEIRSVRGDLGVEGGAKVPLTLVGASDETQSRATRYRDILMRLARLESLEVADATPDGAVSTVVGETTLALKIADLIDVDEAKALLDKDIAALDKDISSTEKKLGNANFVERAPPEIVEENRERIVEWTARREKLGAARARLDAI